MRLHDNYLVKKAFFRVSVDGREIPVGSWQKRTNHDDGEKEERLWEEIKTINEVLSKGAQVRSF